MCAGIVTHSSPADRPALHSFKFSQICFCMGDHTADAYSSCGRTKVVYAMDLRCLLWTWCFFLGILVFGLPSWRLGQCGGPRKVI